MIFVCAHTHKIDRWQRGMGRGNQRGDENDLENNAVLRQTWPKDHSKGKERAVNTDNRTLVRHINKIPR